MRRAKDYLQSWNKSLVLPSNDLEIPDLTSGQTFKSDTFRKNILPARTPESNYIPQSTLPTEPSEPTVSKDMYLNIGEFVDDKTLLSMLSVNKDLYSDNYLRRLMNKRYPFLERYKEPDESYRHFYARMIYYISLLKEEFDFPYIPHTEFNPEVYYTYVKESAASGQEYKYTYALTNGLSMAAGIGNFKLVDHFISKGATLESEWPISEAAKYGHKDIVIYLLDKGNGWGIKAALSAAAENGHMDLVVYLLDHGAALRVSTIVDATKGGHIDILRYLLDRGSVDLDTRKLNMALNQALAEAVKRDHMDMVLLLLDRGATDLNGALATAALRGHMDMVIFFLEKGATDIDRAIRHAQLKDYHEGIINYLRDYQRSIKRNKRK